MRTTLVLFTGSYPYSVAAENTFLPQEIAVLREHFERVIVVPTVIGGTRENIREGNVEVDASFAKFASSLARRTAYALAGLADARLWRELRPRLLMFVRRPLGLARLLRADVTARMTEQWIADRLDAAERDRTVLCTWWFEGTTLGLATFASRGTPRVPVVSRAHGRDIYEWRHDPPYIPFRAASLALVDAVYSVSDAGATYLREHYPAFSEKIGVAHLGIDDRGVAARPSADGVFRIVSCSVLVPVKRVDLMVRGIAAAGRAFPDQKFEWMHVGVGPERPAVERLAAASMPSNVKHHFIDYQGDRQLFELYRAQPADVFMNTSASEGAPVALMEAMSVGLPVIATNVGGNPELVGAENGIVIPANPTPEEIAAAIGTLLVSDETRARMRAASLEKWSARYSSTRNYESFAKTLQAL